ncbi:MAG: RHS repeat-associated core domain-containing protein [bacterium]
MIASSTTYYPFGMPLKSLALQAYRFGFNGKEKDPEWTGTEGSHLAFRYRIHDARIGRFLSIDPLTKDYPWNSPYAFSENRVIDRIELEGLEAVPITYVDENTGENVKQIRITIEVVSSSYVEDKTLLRERVDGIASQLQESYSGSDLATNTRYEMNINVEYNLENSEPEAEYYMELVQNVDGCSYWSVGSVDNIGDSQENRIQVEVAAGTGNPDGTNNSKDETDRTGAHEVLHTLGLRHPQLQDSDNDLIFGTENLMYQGGNGTDLTNTQRERAFKEVEKDYKPPKVAKDVENHY